MNKFIVFPLVVMLMLAFGGIYVDLIANPGTSSMPGGNEYQIVVNENGLIVFQKGDDLIGIFTNDMGYYPYDPRSAPEEPLKLYGDVPGGQVYYADLADFDSHWGTHFTDTSSTMSGKTTYDLFNTGLFWGLVFAILGATVILGVRVFGVGLSEFAQRNSFLGIVWGTIWLFLSATSSSLLLRGDLGDIGWMIYVFLTLGYIIGVIMEVTAND